jgi:hypothetical protein
MQKTVQIQHYPNLNTILMVEDTLKNMDYSVIKISKLKKILPRQVNHNTLMQIIEYLEESNKILFGSKGITWTYNPGQKMAEAIARGRRVK